jgi:outer membrane protein assembly factor BamE (lipoprotein component of BamABCDE complex)
MKKKSSFILLFSVISLLLTVGCTTTTFNLALRSQAESNNRGLLMLKLGMNKDDVYKVMKTPDNSEGFEWGTAWIYRTSANNSVRYKGALDESFTPVVFDRDDKLIGWGRQVYIQKNPELQ